MDKQPSIPSGVLENICRVIANTDTGLTGTEIERLLAESSIKESHSLTFTH